MKVAYHFDVEFPGLRVAYGWGVERAFLRAIHAPPRISCRKP